MKDIIENRFRISLGTKTRLLAMSVRQNGVIWTALIGLYYIASALEEKSFALADRLRHKRGLPGMNSPAMNKVIWDGWDWTGGGEEWTHSAAWKQSVVEKFLAPNVSANAVVVELGPGGGRWTGELQSRAAKVMGIDISEACIVECRKRFTGCDNVEFWVGNGTDLDGVSSSSVDTFWSFDVFVHINRPEFQAYMREVARVLKPGGMGIIQHGANGGATGGWRSDVTSEDVLRFIASAGLETADQIQSWRDAGQEFEAGLYGDIITIFRKPNKLGS